MNILTSIRYKNPFLGGISPYIKANSEEFDARMEQSL